MASSTALVKYQRQPRFYFAPAHAAELSRFDPYGVLGLQCEDVRALLDTLACAAGGAESSAAAHERLALRNLAVREAYRDLAARFHPDTGTSTGESNLSPSFPRLCTWMSLLDHFAAVTAAYGLLTDAHATAAYLLAAQAGRASTDDNENFELHKRADRAARAARSHRRVAALQERERMFELVHAARTAQEVRQRSTGDGLFVDVALYGDARAISRILSLALPSRGPPNVAKLGTSEPSHELQSVANVRDICDVDPHSGQFLCEPSVIDVTDQLAALVDVVPGPGGHGTGVQLALPPGTKCGIEGVWDPCEGFPCTLFVRYTFLGRLHEATVGDEDSLKCPLKRHLVACAPATDLTALRLKGQAGVGTSTARGTGAAGGGSSCEFRTDTARDSGSLETTHSVANPCSRIAEASTARRTMRAFGRELNTASASDDASGALMQKMKSAADGGLRSSDNISMPIANDDVVTYTRVTDADGNIIIVESTGAAAGVARAAAATAVARIPRSVLVSSATTGAMAPGGRRAGGAMALDSRRRRAAIASGVQNVVAHDPLSDNAATTAPRVAPNATLEAKALALQRNLRASPSPLPTGTTDTGDNKGDNVPDRRWKLSSLTATSVTVAIMGVTVCIATWAITAHYQRVPRSPQGNGPYGGAMKLRISRAFDALRQNTAKLLFATWAT